MAKRGVLKARGGDSAARELPSPPPLARPRHTAHHPLRVLVALRAGGLEHPVAGARVVVRPMPLGQVREGDPIARGTTGSAGSVGLLLPAGRYTVTATHGPAKRRVLVTVERPGRVHLTLDADGARLVTLTIEARLPNGAPAVGAPMEARLARSGVVVARGVTDERGAAALLLPPAEYDVAAAGASARVRLAEDAVVRLDLLPPARPPPDVPYLRRVRAAKPFPAPFERDAMDEDLWN